MKIDAGVAAIVTGGASGLGEATARALAAKGAKVALFDLNEERGEEVADAIGGVFARVDVTDEASVDEGFAAARAANGQERILVNCAGIAPAAKIVRRDRETGAITPLPVAKFAQAMQINVVGTFQCMAKSAAGMMSLDPLGDDGERGAIVNTASVAAEDGQIGQIAYAGSKAAVKGMTLPAARDLMGEGIRVNAILPGIFRTPMMAGFSDKVQDALAASVPFPKRLGDPAEYAALVCFLVETGYMNGECVRLDGAIRMPPK